MSTMIYNGISIQVIKTNEVIARPVWSSDGTDYLYTHIVLDIEGIINPQATSYKTDGDTGIPNQKYGELSPNTALAIRGALELPRKSFTYNFSDPSIISNAFINIKSGDSYIGPKTEVVHLSRVAGVKKIVVRFRIECWVYDCAGKTRCSAPILLSNRWQQTQTYDEQRLCTQVTAGEIILRLDAANTQNMQPDDFRSMVLPPVPLTFKRMSIDIIQNSVGDRLSYKVVDREQMYYLGATTSPLRRSVEKFQATYSQTTVPLEGTALPGGFVIATFNGRAWGNSQSNIDDMTTWLMIMAIARLAIPFNRAPNFIAGEGMLREIMVQEHLDDRIVDISVKAQLNAAVLAKFGGAGSMLQWNRLGVPNSLLTQNFTTDGKNPQMPNDTNTRGTYYGQVLAQALASPCATAPPPPTAFGLNKGTAADNYATDMVPTTVTLAEGTQPGSVFNNFNTDTPGIAGITDYKIDTLYSTNQNVAVGTVSGPLQSNMSGVPVSPPPEVMTLAGQVTYRIVEFTAECAGGTPAQPQPFVNDPTWVLCERDWTPAAPIIATDGYTIVNRSTGRFVYASTTGLGAGDAVQLATSVVPWTNFSFNNAFYAPTDFVHGIIDAANTMTGSAAITGGPAGAPGPQV